MCLLTPDAMTKFTAEVGPKALFDPEVKAALDMLGKKSEAQTVNSDGTILLSGKGTLQADGWPAASHRCPGGLSDYNPESIFRSLAGNVYHYPPSVILAKGCHRLIHSYASSLQV